MSRSHNRRRSGTLSSLLAMTPTAPAPPLIFGDSKTFASPWHHEPTKDYPDVVLNCSAWPGAEIGDVIEIASKTPDLPGFLFVVSPEPVSNHQLQLSISKAIVTTFSIPPRLVTLTKVNPSQFTADYVELYFRDQYLGRSDMWRFGKFLEGKCLRLDQEVTFAGCIKATVKMMYRGGSHMMNAYIASRTKIIYRSLSARVTIFIQVCKELWEFAGDGERYYEKIIHSFLPTLFNRWREQNTNHLTTIVLISRVFYDQSELEYAAGPICQDDIGRFYKDFYKVITDLEVVSDWKPTLNGLKDSLWAFQRDILLTHHYHAQHAGTSTSGPEAVRLVGNISFAHDGPILEAINLALNPTESHFIDRSLSVTGCSTVIITPGTGHFRVSRALLRMTTARLLDLGFGVDLLSLAKAPLHITPVFSFLGFEPELNLHGTHGSRDFDVLWGGDEEEDGRGKAKREKTLFYWQPFWMLPAFWDIQMDAPFRETKFIPRAKMNGIQMLGLLDHDLSSISIPFLETGSHNELATKEAQEEFDRDTFAPTSKPPSSTRTASLPSLASSATTVQGTFWLAGASRERTIKKTPSNTSLKTYSRRESTILEETQKTIPEQQKILMSGRHSRRSPGRRSSSAAVSQPLPSGGNRKAAPSITIPRAPSPSPSVTFPSTSIARFELGNSPSQSSLHSQSSSSASDSLKQRRTGAPQQSLASKFASSWLFTPFRSTSQNPPILQPSPKPTPQAIEPVPLPTRSPAVVTQTPRIDQPSPRPIAIKGTLARRQLQRSRTEDDINLPPPATQRNSYTRTSPLSGSPRNTPPVTSVLRTSVGSVQYQQPTRFDPSRLATALCSTQSSLARRWEHIIPLPTFEHQVKWKSLCAPACLPLSVEYFPNRTELDKEYRVHSYEVVIGSELHNSYLARRPQEDQGDAWALAVMKVMASLRLAQGFQFVLGPSSSLVEPGPDHEDRTRLVAAIDDSSTPKPRGASDILTSTEKPIYLSMSDQIHRISYDPVGECIQIKRYARRQGTQASYQYRCLIWTKLGSGYTETQTIFRFPSMDQYGWNRADMMALGYEQHFSESLRYWRTRFLVVPTEQLPTEHNAPRTQELLTDEESRLLGMGKLAELWGKARWLRHGESADLHAPPRFIPTTLDPAACVLDEILMSRLEELHEAGPLRKRPNCDRSLEEASLQTIAKAMRDPDMGMSIKDHQWHFSTYPDSFTGDELVSWLVKEWRDVSNRDQGTEWGARLQTQGLFEHCRGHHGFLDGHYFYRLKSPYNSKPKQWFRPGRVTLEERTSSEGQLPRINSAGSRGETSPRKSKRRHLILSQSLVIDLDPARRSDQAETAVLHHDLIQNPETAFHFELHWIGTTGRFIDDMLQTWNSAIEKNGLKIVEGYIDQITDVHKKNVFQSCFPIPLALEPPTSMPNPKNIDGPRLPIPRFYFEYALLRSQDFVWDIEDKYSDQVDVWYSYRPSAFTHPQWVHRSGLAFVQVVGGSEGFRWLTNRLGLSGQLVASRFKQQRHRDNQNGGPAAVADCIRQKLFKMCADVDELRAFYDGTMLQLLKKETRIVQIMSDTLSVDQLIELLVHLRGVASTSPDQARTIINSHPGLPYLLITTLANLNLVDPQVLQRTIASVVQTPGALPPPAIPPPAQVPFSNGYGTGPGAQPAGVPTYVAPPQALPQATDPQALLMRLMALTPEQINQLPPADRATFLQLRQQFLGAS